MKTFIRFLFVALIGLSVLVPCFSQNQEPLELFDGLYSGMSIEESYVRAVQIFTMADSTSIQKFGTFFAGFYRFEYGQFGAMDVLSYNTGRPGQASMFLSGITGFNVIHFVKGNAVVGELYFAGEGLIAVRVYESEPTYRLEYNFNRVYGEYTVNRFLDNQQKSFTKVWRQGDLLITLVDFKSSSTRAIDFVDRFFIEAVEAQVPGDYYHLNFYYK
jgi:hypothetical protein